MRACSLCAGETLYVVFLSRHVDCAWLYANLLSWQVNRGLAFQLYATASTASRSLPSVRFRLIRVDLRGGPFFGPRLS